MVDRNRYTATQKMRAACHQRKKGETVMSVVRQRVQVMPGHRVELVAPELNDGEWVEVVIRADADLPAQKTNVLAFIDSLPGGPRAAADWDAYERLLQQERESWEQ